MSELKFYDNDNLVIGGGDWELAPFKFSKILKIGGGTEPSYIDIIISGTTSVTLTNAISLNYVKLFGGTEQLPENYIDSVTLDGKCEQSGTPTPTVPVDIVCNNGTIKFSANMANVNAQTALVGYYISTQGVVTADVYNWIYQDFIPVKPNTTYTLTMSSSVYYVSISEYSTADNSGFVVRKAGSTGSNTTLTITTGSTTNYIRFGTNLNRVAVTLDAVLAIDWMLNVGSTMAYQPYVEGGIYTDGTVETATDSLGNVATAQMLLGVGDTKDTQSIIDGSVTRNIGIKVLDGTENWAYSDGWSDTTHKCFYMTLDDIKQQTTSSNECLCSHLEWYTRDNLNADKTIIGGCISGYVPTDPNSGKALTIRISSSIAKSATDLKAWLSDQYNAGTPVIIVYPTSSATTETVTPQVLQKEPVTVTGSLTGLVANVVSSSHTTPTPTQPLPINCNNGVLKVNSQGQIYTDGTVETVGITGKNLLDLANCVDGYYYDSNGVYSEASPARLSNFVKVKVNEIYTVFVYGLKGSANVRVNLFDTNKTWLSQQITSSTLNRYTAITVTATQDGYLAFSANFVTTGSCIDWSVSQIVKGSYTVATMPEYEPYYNGGTATAEMLLKVGDYQDEQNVINGHITRNVGIKLLDGTENWQLAKATDLVQFYTASTQDIIKNNVSLMSTIAPYGCTVANRARYNFGCYSGNSGNLCFQMKGSATLTTVNAWTSFLANQYNAGTPVIIVYPLATATTETVTGQHLTVQNGTNIVEITQASIDGLPLEVSYKQQQ